METAFNDDNQDTTISADIDTGSDTMADPKTSNIPPDNTNVNNYTSDSVLQGTNEATQTRFPVRSNQGVPRKQYDPDLMAKGKYPINNYVSKHRLAEPHAHFVDKLEKIHIPRDIGEAMKDENWRKAVNEEMRALLGNDT